MLRSLMPRLPFAAPPIVIPAKAGIQYGRGRFQTAPYNAYHQSLISRPYRLFDFDHFAGARLLAHLQAIHIDSGGDGSALRVAAIPS